MSDRASEQSERLFLDCDGVLADFDKAFIDKFGHTPRDYENANGQDVFWRDIRNEAPTFYRDLPLMPDAMELFNAVKHLRPIILTGVPRGEWAELQKLAWAREHFPGVPMVVCRARDKCEYCQPGDVLIDDRDQYRSKWEKAGGRFIHHKSAAESLAAFRLLTTPAATGEGEQRKTDDLCEKCGVGFILPSGVCDHCNYCSLPPTAKQLRDIAAANRAELDSLDEYNPDYFACFTGDCPHDKASDCLESVKAEAETTFKALRQERHQVEVYRKRMAEASEPLIEHGPFAVMAGAPWNVLDSRGCRIACCGGDSNADWERFGPAIAAAIVKALNRSWTTREAARAAATAFAAGEGEG